MLKELIMFSSFCLVSASGTLSAEKILEEWECPVEDIEWVIDGDGLSKSQPIMKKIFFRELNNGNYEIVHEDSKSVKELTPIFSDKWVTVLIDSLNHEGLSVRFYGLWKKGGERLGGPEMPVDEIRWHDEPLVHQELMLRLAEGLRDETRVLMMTNWRVGWGSFGRVEFDNENMGIYGNVVSEPESQVAICKIK